MAEARSPLVDAAPRRWFARAASDPLAPPKPRWRRDDVMVAALGLSLGLICALFPWYIFFNPDKFGPPAITFDSAKNTSGVARQGGGGQGRLGSGTVSDMAAADFDAAKLDLFATGATPDRGSVRDEVGEQPFPAPPAPFHLVYVANGRAMMEDDTGVFVVGPGDRLPDNSRVARIEERGGRWVLVTSKDAVMEAVE
ncbi:MAG: hypothetical protein DI629_02795 [Mesorhizobium amorphae]|nr:MAG: hypothetical protein DI629_02795 [Mesorhizobium amorphae]